MGFTMNPADIRLGPCMLTFGSTPLGGTMEGVKVTLTPEFQDLLVDQYGSVPIDSVLTSQKYEIETILAASADKDLWKMALPYSVKRTSGPNKSIHVNNSIGTNMRQFAEALVLHPLAKGDADFSEDFKFFKVIVKSAIEVEYGPTNQRGLKVVFSVLPDTDVTPSRYFIFGDPAIGLVEASAAAPAPGGENTGNGTCTDQSAGSKTKTETITITCIGTNGSHKSAWKVVGSVSGHIGTVELTGGSGDDVEFESDYVNFTLTDGDTDFVVGDLFTIATTGANYA